MGCTARVGVQGQYNSTAGVAEGATQTGIAVLGGMGSTLGSDAGYHVARKYLEKKTGKKAGESAKAWCSGGGEES